MSGLFDGVSGLALVAGLGLLVQQDIGGAGLDVNAAWWTAPQWIAADGNTPALIPNFNDDQYALPQYGPELISNGDFSIPTTSPWTTNGTNQLSIVDNALRITTAGTPGFPRANRLITTEPGKTYFFSAQARRVSGTSGAEVGLYTSQTVFIATFGSTTSATFVTISGYFIAPTTSTMLFLNIASGASVDGDAVEFDNISLREVMCGDVGTDLVLNGAFATNLDSWVDASTAPATVTHSSSGSTGALFTISGGNTPRLRQSITTVAGASYTLICRQFNAAAGTNLFVSVGTTAGGVDVMPSTAVAAVAATGWNYFSFIATSTTTWINFSGSGSSTATLDSVSVRQWTARPTLRSATFAEVFTFTASSTTARTYIDSTGIMRNDLAVDQPRFTWVNGKRQLLLENASTNQIANGDGVGSVAGTPGTFPTGWQSSQPTGITRTIVGSGIENGIPYVEIRYQGTASSSADIVFDPQVNSAVTASVGQTWTFSEYLRLVSGGVTPTRQFAITLAERLAAGTFLTGTTTFFTPTTTYTRYTQTRTLTDATVARVSGAIRLNITSGDVVDITIRVGAAQLEAQTFASAYIPTTTATVNRAVESAQLSPLAQAIVNRAACTIAVRGRLSNTGTAARALFGNDSSGTLLFAASASQTLVSNWNGASGISGTLGSGAFNTSAFGAVLAFDSGGRVVAANGGAIASDTAAVGNKAVTYLGRSPGSATWGDGFYDNFVLYAARVSNAAIPAMAVAA